VKHPLKGQLNRFLQDGHGLDIDHDSVFPDRTSVDSVVIKSTHQWPDLEQPVDLCTAVLDTRLPFASCWVQRDRDRSGPRSTPSLMFPIYTTIEVMRRILFERCPFWWLQRYGHPGASTRYLDLTEGRNPQCPVSSSRPFRGQGRRGC
jgi:hypothetical protein